jgi:hypothetical protein
MALIADVDKKVLRFYVNGKEIGSDISYSSLTEITGTRYFGWGRGEVYGGNGPGGALPMEISDIRLYNHALSQEEIRIISQGLVFHYNFEEHENTFVASEYVKSPTARCTLAVYGGTGLVFTSSGNDPYVDNYATAAAQDKSSRIAFSVKAGYTYYLSWRHVSGPEFNKNIYSLYDANNKSVVIGTSGNYKGFSAVAYGTWRRAAITIPSDSTATQISIRLGN